MAFTKLLIAVCSLAAIAEGQFGFRNYPNFPFGGYQPMFMRPLPIFQPPRLPGRFQTPPLPQPPFLPLPPFGFGVDYRNPFDVEVPRIDVPRRGSGQFSETYNIGGGRGGFSGMTVMSTSNGGDGGVTIVSTNKNGDKETYISEGDGNFYKVPAPSATPGKGVVRLEKMSNKLMRGISKYLRQTLPAVKFEQPEYEFFY